MFRIYPERPGYYWSLTNWIWQVDAISGLYLACVQTSPISFVTKEIGDVCNKGNRRRLHAGNPHHDKA